MLRRIALTLALLAPLAAAAAPPAPGPALFFGLAWIDTSGEGLRGDQTARLAMIEDQIAADLTARGFTVTRIAPVDRPAVVDASDCNGCDMTVAHRLGAAYAVTGRVQKVSNLILSITLFVRDASTRQTVAAGSVDLRGNTDESWSRGARYLLKNVIFRD